MTPAQNTTAYIQGFEDGKRALVRLIEEAVKAEREACAKVCWEMGVSAHHAMYAADVAEAIRARGEA